MEYIVRDAKEDELFHVTAHGHYYANGYKGCSEGCPFCYWESIPGWHGKIEIWQNIPQLLDKALEHWPRDRYLYLGSFSNPYEVEVESKYHVTREMLKVIIKHGNPVCISTSTSLVLSDLDLLKHLPEGSVVVMELVRFKRLKALYEGGVHEGIYAARELKRNGIKVWATLAPFCPGITDVEKVLEALGSDIPLYVDALDAPKGSLQAQLVLRDVERDFPQLLPKYREMIETNSKKDFEEMVKQLGSRICRFPFPLP